MHVRIPVYVRASVHGMSTLNGLYYKNVNSLDWNGVLHWTILEWAGDIFNCAHNNPKFFIAIS